MAEMISIKFWHNHRSKKQPKQITREPRIIELPKYVTRQLNEHINTFIHQEYKIEDVIFTLRCQHQMFCDYMYDGENGYILTKVNI